MAEKLCELKKRGSAGGTELHYMVCETAGGGGPFTISCAEGYFFCVSSSPHIVVKIDGIQQTPIYKAEPSSYYYNQVFHFQDLNNAILSMDKGRGMLAYI